MIAIFNRLSVEKGATGQVVERFASSRGYVQGLSGFVSMEILSSEGADKVLVVARWQSKDAPPSSACCSRRRSASPSIALSRPCGKGLPLA
ncbi:MAG: antibiotic biosynthesis monooxygenase [Actinomycetota bacterium]|nr:antibiotic biosynthesis monooxygenase [Actinomycetota bacterium]